MKSGCDLECGNTYQHLDEALERGLLTEADIDHALARVLGTRFKLLSTGHEYVIEDYGSALVGRQTIDLFFPKRAQVRNWGVRHEQIEILEWGSQAMSLKLLAPRSRNSHVAIMIAQLKKQGVIPPS